MDSDIGMVFEMFLTSGPETFKFTHFTSRYANKKNTTTRGLIVYQVYRYVRKNYLFHSRF